MIAAIPIIRGIERMGCKAHRAGQTACNNALRETFDRTSGISGMLPDAVLSVLAEEAQTNNG